MIEINYSELSTILASATQKSTESNIIKEIIKITSQEYSIGFQPNINLMIWTIIRIILCWYADEELHEKIFKVKILINLFKSRKSEPYNKNRVESLITICPEYGKSNACYVLTHMNLYFFRFKEFGEKNNKPTFYKAIDGGSLIFYTNGSSDMKRYIELLKNKNLKDVLYNNKMTQINEKGASIEYKLNIINNKDIILPGKTDEIIKIDN